ncbi:DUF6012 family protein [Rhizobium sp. AC27/96]|uniref:DUF6012 family protein n=1 Tax=Rhizobium sp. AC27/96 TaxID=1841653 RepID=UPI0011474A2B|nr:DUF6012 family protein [Rhizobium sp. AC27/96]
MIIHVRPRFLLSRDLPARVDLVDLQIPEFGFHAHSGFEVTARRIRGDIDVLAVCKNNESKSADGILLETPGHVKCFSTLTCWRVRFEPKPGFEIDRTVTHYVRYVILDEEFNVASDDMALWNLHGWRPRVPAWSKGISPAIGEPLMELKRGNRLDTCVDRVQDGFVIERFELFTMPTIEVERFAEATVLRERMPGFDDRFKTTLVLNHAVAGSPRPSIVSHAGGLYEGG